MQKLHISKTHSSSFSQHIFIHDHCCTCVCVSEEEYGVLILHTSHVIDLLEVLVKALIVVSTQSGSSCSCTCEPPSASDSACQSNPLPLAGHSLRLTDHASSWGRELYDGVTLSTIATLYILKCIWKNLKVPGFSYIAKCVY